MNTLDEGVRGGHRNGPRGRVPGSRVVADAENHPIARRRPSQNPLQTVDESELADLRNARLTLCHASFPTSRIIGLFRGQAAERPSIHIMPEA